jgi:thioredoxin reductase
MSPWWLRATVMSGADVRTRTTVSDVRVDGNTVVLKTAEANGTVAELSVDHVIAATGYAADIDRLTFIDSTIRGTLRRVGSMPELSHGFESSVPGLYFLGTAAAGSFGPLLRFVAGAPFAAPRVSAHILRRSSRRRLRTPALARA